MDGFIVHKRIDEEIEISPQEMAKLFAEGDSTQQAAFLNEAFQAMFAWGDARDVFQISYIVKDLSPISKHLLREMVAHIEDEEAP